MAVGVPRSGGGRWASGPVGLSGGGPAMALGVHSREVTL